MRDTGGTRIPHYDEIRAFIVTEILRREKDGYQCADKAEDVPEEYGDYFCHDGIGICGAGSVRNLRSKFVEVESRGLQMPIFLWKPDIDESVRKLLDGPHEQTGDCRECGGIGKVECSGCLGSGLANQGDDS